MPDFGEMADKAKDFAGDHDKQSDEALDKATDFAGDKTGNKYDSQIQSGEDKAEGYLGVDNQDKDQQSLGSN
jgi:hypothetical protein